MAENSFSIGARARSFTHAFRGIAMMLRSQHNAWIQLAVSIATVCAGLAVHFNRAEWCGIVLAIVSVWTAEAFNTAIEFVCDVASPEFHHGIKCAKDVAAGAVLITAAGAIAIGLLISIPHVR